MIREFPSAQPNAKKVSVSCLHGLVLAVGVSGAPLQSPKVLGKGSEYGLFITMQSVKTQSWQRLH